MTPSTGEAVVRRAARRLGLQAAGMVAVVVLAVAGFGAWITVRQESANAQMLVVAAASNADDVIDPPAGMWLAMRDADGVLHATKGMPAGLPDLSALDSPTPPADSTVELAAGHFLVHTAKPPDGKTVQAVLALRPWEAQRNSLLVGLLAAAIIGLAFAAVAGVLLARRALTPLQRTLRLQRQFVADASHELRTPLTLLHTRVQLLHRDLRDAPERLRDEAAGVVRDSSRLTELVEDLLLAADGDGTATEVDLEPLVADVIGASRSYAEEHGITIDHDLTPAIAQASAAALHRALTALVDNAIEHTPPGGTVTITVRAAGHHARLAVRDTGTGFSPGQAAELTTRFHSGGQRSGRRRYGLGLALVNDIADRYGGRLEADSEPGRGATFTLVLPRANR
ncbi:sensor histidine kinase [Kutzneria sp. CA-103260]|uniref:sensor histidine kinase n=1 Tax=Kutzneria sp. CA-103260 TaxID=2802641 RepID=UPI001BA9EBF3|nr:HAMP domain-containing sensor histidine kinase [Kutzneria sp. CA-103260]QUQ63989.1 two-component system histidine kinase [Kutzneria sp. CA-103260]